MKFMSKTILNVFNVHAIKKNEITLLVSIYEAALKNKNIHIFFCLFEVEIIIELLVSHELLIKNVPSNKRTELWLIHESSTKNVLHILYYILN